MIFVSHHRPTGADAPAMLFAGLPIPYINCHQGGLCVAPAIQLAGGH